MWEVHFIHWWTGCEVELANSLKCESFGYESLFGTRDEDQQSLSNSKRHLKTVTNQNLSPRDRSHVDVPTTKPFQVAGPLNMLDKPMPTFQPLLGHHWLPVAQLFPLALGQLVLNRPGPQMLYDMIWKIWRCNPGLNPDNGVRWQYPSWGPSP